MVFQEAKHQIAMALPMLVSILTPVMVTAYQESVRSMKFLDGCTPTCHDVIDSVVVVNETECFIKVYAIDVLLFHTMAYLYVIYRYVISIWRLVRPIEINQYDITMASHYDITMGNDVAMDAHCEITMVNDVARDIHYDITMINDNAMCTYDGITMASHYDITMGNDVARDITMINDNAMCTYDGITMHNDIAMNIFYYVFSALCLIVLFVYV